MLRTLAYFTKDTHGKGSDTRCYMTLKKIMRSSATLVWHFHSCDRTHLIDVSYRYTN